jgi:hypothetical protein
MTDKTVWTHDDMIEAALEWWGDPNLKAADCEVVEDIDGDDQRCLVVRHKPTNTGSTEAGDGGRWHLDGTAYGD